MSSQLRYASGPERHALLHHRPAASHYLACYILQQWDRALVSVPVHARPQFASDQRFAPLMYVAYSVLRQHGLELGFHAELKDPEVQPGFRFFHSGTITRLLGQCLEEGWVQPDRDHVELYLTNSGANVVLEWSHHIFVPWSLRPKSPGGLSADSLVLPISDERIGSVLDDALTPLYRAPNRMLRQALISAAGQVLNGWDRSPYVESKSGFWDA